MVKQEILIGTVRVQQIGYFKGCRASLFIFLHDIRFRSVREDYAVLLFRKFLAAQIAVFRVFVHKCAVNIRPVRIVLFYIGPRAALIAVLIIRIRFQVHQASGLLRNRNQKVSGVSEKLSFSVVITIPEIPVSLRVQNVARGILFRIVDDIIPFLTDFRH